MGADDKTQNKIDEITGEAKERIQAGDELLIVTPENQRLNTEERLRAVGQRGRLARWRARAEE